MEPEHDIRRRLDARDYRAAFELLMERFQDRVFRLAVSIVHDEALAQDLAQEIFLRVWKALPAYHGDATLSTWLYAISRNTCLTELRRRAARATVSFNTLEFADRLDIIPEVQTADAPAGAELDVATLLGQLPERYRRVLTLFYLEQKSYEDVAALLGLPMGTVKTFLHRAKKQLLKLTQRPTPVCT